MSAEAERQAETKEPEQANAEPQREDKTGVAPTEQQQQQQQEKHEQPTAPEVPKYRSIVLSSFGGSKHVRVELLELKALGENDVEIEVEACGVNFLDVMLRQGLVDQSLKPPFTMGSECAGTVLKVGEKVKDFKAGDRVVALVEHGAWTERLIVSLPEASEEGAAAAGTAPVTPPKESSGSRTALLLRCPSGLPANKAAVTAFAYLPAHLMLHQAARVRDGDVVLVHSAAGGVGSAIGQLAKCLSNVKLIGTASKAKHEKIAYLYDHLFTPDQDYVREIKLLYPQGIDLILDCLGSEELSRTSCLLKPMGKYILYGMSSLVTGDRKNIFTLAKNWFHAERINPLKLYDDNRALGGFSLKSLLFPRQASESAQRLATEWLIRQCWTELVSLIDQHRIDPWLDGEWNFDQIKEAMLRLQERKNIGKVVLLPKAKAEEPVAS